METVLGTALGILLIGIPVLICAGITLRAVDKEKTTEEDAHLLKAFPEEFHGLITLETLGKGGWLAGLILVVIGAVLLLWNQGWLLPGAVSGCGVLLIVVGTVVKKRAWKRRRELCRALSLPERERPGMRALASQVPQELSDHLESNVRIRRDELQAVDMFLRDD